MMTLWAACRASAGDSTPDGVSIMSCATADVNCSGGRLPRKEARNCGSRARPSRSSCDIDSSRANRSVGDSCFSCCALLRAAAARSSRARFSAALLARLAADRTFGRDRPERGASRLPPSSSAQWTFFLPALKKRSSGNSDAGTSQVSVSCAGKSTRRPSG
ncbi:hypothetical protein GCM10023196_016970 [Actinoallomurus vinaceus]|uniref:Secreted protein n=1 Tax=Actinoallomurus vinaceus TaxID=1080074 RepID=A0ABP8U7C3_9ACTN